MNMRLYNTLTAKNKVVRVVELIRNLKKEYKPIKVKKKMYLNWVKKSMNSLKKVREGPLKKRNESKNLWRELCEAINQYSSGDKINIIEVKINIMYKA